MKVIPIRSDITDYIQKTELEGTVYTFGFHYNERFEAWTMDILTSAEEPILMGIPVHINWPLLRQYKDSRLPPGILFAINIEEENTPPNESNFGSAIQLLYEESSE